MPDTDSLVRLSNVHLAFGDTPVLNGIDISVRRGEAVSIIGPSGSGKSTILRCITGLLRPQQGGIRVGDVDVQALRRERDLIALRQPAPEDHKFAPAGIAQRHRGTGHDPVLLVGPGHGLA